MDFEFDDDQLELQRVVREVVDNECPPSLVRAVVEGSDDGSALWKTLGSMELPGMTVPHEHGGAGAGAVELVLTLEELGRGADPTGFLATSSQFVPVVRECFGDDGAARLGTICRGGTGTAAFAPDTVHAEPVDHGWRLFGTARHVVDADRADELAVVATAGDHIGVFIVPPDEVAAVRTPSFDATLHVGEVAFDATSVPIERSVVGPDVDARVARAHQEAVTGMAAVIVGACQRILDLTLDHIRERHQFGVPIGSFQAVKHLAVDMFVAIQRARALTLFSALTIAEDDDRRSVAPSMAKVAAGDAQRIVCRHGIQLFGGLGYTWENDLHLFVRRAKAGELLLGGSAEHRPVVARAALAGDGSAGQQRFDESTEAFRREFSTWLDENTPNPSETTVRSRSSADIPEWARRWQRAMFDAGWLVPGNPPEYGGRNASILEQFVHLEELSRRRIYKSYNPQGLGIIAPSVLSFGTEEQKRRWAVPILRAEITAALGMSEPDAGSDLAALRTRAELDGDHFIVNGQKVWTSGAHDADVILTFVRTDPDVAKHRGLSVLMIPTDSPGLTRRPFGSIISPGELDFNEVFFDDVVVPRENLIGDLNDGWRVATGSLGHERSMLWLGYAELLDDLVVNGGRALRDAGLSDDPVALDRFGTVVTDAQAIRALGYRTLAKARRGEMAAEPSILKLFGSEAVQDADLFILEALGPDALDHTRTSAPARPQDPDVYNPGWFDLYLRSFSGTIAGGTSQIQRNIIAERVLGLPR